MQRVSTQIWTINIKNGCQIPVEASIHQLKSINRSGRSWARREGKTDPSGVFYTHKIAAVLSHVVRYYVSSWKKFWCKHTQREKKRTQTKFGRKTPGERVTELL